MKKFLEIFDKDQNGVLDKYEFADFMKFAICKSYIEQQYALEEEQMLAEMDDMEAQIDGSITLDNLLDDLKGNIGSLDQIFLHLPKDVQVSG